MIILLFRFVGEKREVSIKTVCRVSWDETKTTQEKNLHRTLRFFLASNKTHTTICPQKPWRVYKKKTRRKSRQKNSIWSTLNAIAGHQNKTHFSHRRVLFAFFISLRLCETPAQINSISIYIKYDDNPLIKHGYKTQNNFISCRFVLDFYFPSLSYGRRVKFTDI